MPLTVNMSWWFKVCSVSDGNLYDTVLNRIEKERINAERMGMTLVVEAHPLSSSYNLYLTPSIDGTKVQLYGDNCEITVDRNSLYYNGDYVWTNRVVRR